MMTMRVTGGAVLCLALLAPARAGAERIHSQAGTSSAAFLKLPVGARAVGMGEAFTAVSDDVNALAWNPAGLAGLARPAVGAAHHTSFAGMSHEFIGYCQPWMTRQGGQWRRAGSRAWGAGVILLSIPSDLERRSGLNEGGAALGRLTSHEGTFGATDLAVSGSFASRLGAHDAGATLKLVRQTIAGESASTAALDLGWRRRAAARNLDLGAVVQHLGPGVKFNQTRYSLPLTARLGAAYGLEGLRTRLAMDLAVPRDDYPALAFGLEVALKDYLRFRTGYRYRWYGDPLGALAGWRTGLGFVHRDLTLDYAVAILGELGHTHRVSVGWRFGAAAAQAGAGQAPQGPAAAGPQPAGPPAGAAEEPASSAGPSPSGAAGAGGVLYAIRAVPRVVSARGADYLVTASAPAMSAASMTLERLEFRSPLPTAQGLVVAISPGLAGVPLPPEVKASAVLGIRTNAPAAARSAVLYLRPGAGAAARRVFALVDGAWKELAVEVLQADGLILRAASDRLPAAAAIAE